MRPLMKARCLRALHEHFGLDSLRPGQEAAVGRLLRGRDTLCLFPTGAGKSLCYQLPALLLPPPTVVVSPLIALMRDQVAGLRRRGIDAVSLDSLLPAEELRAAWQSVEQGRARLVYVSPERLETERFRAACLRFPPSLIAVDEAHCVVQWGGSFRPAYQEIGRFIRQLPRRPVVCAMTATAGLKTRLAISRSLGMRGTRTITLPLIRENLRYQLVTTIDPGRAIRRLALAHAGGKGLIFCRTRAEAEEMARTMAGWRLPDGRPLRAACYHAGLERAARDQVQEAFAAGRLDAVAATSAFGMGVDIPDIRYVAHLSLPPGLMDLAQQSGRAGRDGQAADCAVLLDPADVDRLRGSLQAEKFAAKHSPRKLLRCRRRWRDARAVLALLLGGGCLPAGLARAFGDRRAKPCGCCSACLRPDGPHRLAPVPPLPEMYPQDVAEWVLTWQRDAFARAHQLAPGEVLADSLLPRAAAAYHIPEQQCHPEALPALQRLLDHMRAVREGRAGDA